MMNRPLKQHDDTNNIANDITIDLYKGDEKLAYEKELETLQLQDDRRKAILRKAGVAK